MSSLFNPFSFFAAVINTATLAMIYIALHLSNQTYYEKPVRSRVMKSRGI